ncbi:hypothetical protein V5799_013052 [Amblyomma americanum]|uniref:Lipocalin-5 1 n=1 Tax=Amblyomma americanum TaxID=6943 RepID=A0AAQ4E6Z5_AMBAM
MHLYWMKAGAGLLLLGLAVATPVAHHRREPLDSFRMLAAFPRVVAIYTSTNDSDFKCLVGIRTSFDMQAKTASYLWPLKGHGGTKRRNVTFDITPGNVTDQTTYYVDGDNTRLHTGYHHYTDYRNCMVMTIRYRNHDHCLLWVKRSVVHSIPQDCVENYEAVCEVRVPTFDNELCSDDEPEENARVA